MESLSLLKLLIIGIWCEAIVDLFFYGAPVQWLRRWLVKKTPFFTFEDYGSLFDCKYCVSFYVGILGVFLYIYLNNPIFLCICVAIVLHRISNYIHVVYRIIVDLQTDIRIRRRRR